MTAQELATIARRRLALVHAGVPEEDAEQHLRNALMVLRGLETTQPAVWVLNPELERAERRARAGLALIRTPHLAVPHVRQAVQALLEVDIDWAVVAEVHAACARLLRCLFLLDQDPIEGERFDR